jgi:CheY-like chemotaxis protein
MAVIVTAEDDVDVADLISTTLTQAGHVVHVAGTGPRALQLVAERHPDLVVLDHNMPGMTGLDVARRLRADEATATLPMLMVSAAAPAGAQDVFDQVLQLPVGMRTVVGAANDLLAASPRTLPVAGRALTDPERLHAVAALLGSPDPVDDLTMTMLMANLALAADCQTAAGSLVLNDTVLTLASVGLPDLIGEAGGLPIEWSPCGVVVGGDRPVLIGDLSTDPIFRDTVLAGPCRVRSYAAAPLRTEAGLVVGALEVMDPEPGRFSSATVRGLIATVPTVLRVLDRRRD